MDVETRTGNVENVDGVAEKFLEVRARVCIDLFGGFRLDDGTGTVERDTDALVQTSRLARKIEEAEMQACGRLYPDTHRRT